MSKTSSKLKFAASTVGKLMIGSHGLTENEQSTLDGLINRRDNFTDPKTILKPLTEKELETLKDLRFRNENGGQEVDGKKVRKLTDNQKKKLVEYEKRFANPTDMETVIYPPTDKMLEKITELEAKRDAPFELSKTAKSLVEDVWRYREHGVRDIITSKELAKGILCEGDSLDLILEVDGDYYRKNEQLYENDFCRCIPDAVRTDDMVAEVKTSWSLKQYMNVDLDAIKEEYYAQVQVEMWTTNTTKAKFYYCLVDTPVKMVWELKRRFYWSYHHKPDIFDFHDAFDFLMENDKQFKRSIEQIEKNHKFSDRIPAEQRVKSIEFELDVDYIKELEKRIKAAREYYDTISL